MTIGENVDSCFGECPKPSFNFMAISVLVADAKAKARQEIVHLLRHDRSVDVIGEASDGREALDMARSTRPNIVLLAGSIMGLDAISVVEEIALSSPDTGVIVVVDEPDLDLIRRLMRSGARDCAVRPLGDDLVATVRGVYETMQKQRDAHGSANVQPTHQGKVIAIYSPQGGAGKSVLAANLAVAWPKRLQAPKSALFWWISIFSSATWT